MTARQVQDLAAIGRLCIGPATSLSGAMTRLNETAMQILLVVSDDGRLAGTLTDGDIRRAILDGKALTDSVAGCFNGHPFTIREGAEAQGVERLRLRHLSSAPLVDAAGRLRGLVRLGPPLDRVALLLAGGRGSRLGEVTRTTPKPLLTVGDKPLLAHLLDNLQTNGFSTVYIAVHHLAEQIVDFVDAHCPPGLRAHYIDEAIPLGTAGALAELPIELSAPLLVVNGDLVTRTSFGAVMDFHHEHGKSMTIGCAQYRHEVPFGVIELNGSDVLRIVEKPPIVRFVSAGVYVLDPIVHHMVPKGEPTDMPKLINMALEAGLAAATFPIVEYWIDVGRPEQLAQARGDYRSASTNPLGA